jgi:hypothetical protein
MVEGMLQIVHCPSLKTLLPEGQLTVPELVEVVIQNCTQLQSLAGLGGLQSSKIELVNLTSLVDLFRPVFAQCSIFVPLGRLRQLGESARTG